MPSMHSDRQGFREYKCPVCGKIFIPIAEIWAYRAESRLNGHPILYCSWKCLRAAEKENERKEEERKAKLKRKSEVTKRKVWGLLRQGFSLREIARETGLNYNTVLYWREKITGEYPGEAGGMAVFEYARRNRTGKVHGMRVPEELDGS